MSLWRPSSNNYLIFLWSRSASGNMAEDTVLENIKVEEFLKLSVMKDVCVGVCLNLESVADHYFLKIQ